MSFPTELFWLEPLETITLRPWEKEIHRLKSAFGGDMLVPRRVDSYADVYWVCIYVVDLFFDFMGFIRMIEGMNMS